MNEPSPITPAPSQDVSTAATALEAAGHIDAGLDTEFHRGLGLFDAAAVVVGSMIGSGIFTVSASMSRQVGSPGWLMVAWLITGVLTIAAALSYGELAGMMPRAGGQYVYLREAFSPLCGFLYGWTLFLVIQTGTIAAVAVAFARFAGVLVPWIDEKYYLVNPVPLFPGYAFSLSTAQLVGVVMIVFLSLTNVGGLRYGKWIQNLFTVAKSGALLALILLGLAIGWNSGVVRDNFGDGWTPRGPEDLGGGLTAVTAWGIFIAVCVSQTGSLFSADAWNNITFAAGEVRNPRRTLPWALALGTGFVILLYLLANVAYLSTLPFSAIQHAPSDRVGTALLQHVFPHNGAALMAAAILISTFGCNNGLILSGARAYYAMARDGLFFRGAGQLNRARVPAWGLVLQMLWASFLVLPRTVTTAGVQSTDLATTWSLAAQAQSHQSIGTGPIPYLVGVAESTLLSPAGKPVYGNLYNDLLDYTMSAALLFYVLTILGLYRLRWTRPEAPRPYRAFGYPLVPALYILGATTIVAVLFVYKPLTTWPGLVLVLLGIPVYFLWRETGSGRMS
jgi:APA family basic amino acid/polyamine antiporter